MDDVGLWMGVLSTLISAIALAGVVVSLLLQARELRIIRIQTFRQSHLELMRLALDNPEIAVEFSVLSSSQAEFVRQVMCNWQLQHIRLGFLTGESSEVATQSGISELFASKAVRDWWTVVRPIWNVEATKKSQRKFVALVDREFESRQTEEILRAEQNSGV